MVDVQEYINREAADIEARKLGLMDSAKALIEKGYEIPDYILADLTQDQKDALTLAQQGIGAYKPFLTQAEQAMQQGLGTTGYAASQLAGVGGAPTQAQLDAYMNPFQQSVIDATMSELDKQGALAQSNLAAQAQSAGAFGGDRFAVQEAELGGNLQDAKIKALAQLNLQNFGQAQAGLQNQLERERLAALGIGALGQQQAQLGSGLASLGAQTQGLAQQDVSNLLNIGGIQQQFDQQTEEIKRRNLLEERMQPYQQLGFLSDIYQGAPTSSQVMSVGGAGTGASPLQQAIGTGVGMLAGIGGLKKLGVF
jgi:hypothetical protein